MRNLPQYPESDYVLRQHFNSTIYEPLKMIDNYGGHILVHGQPGSGKTVAVCQVVRQLITEGMYFRPLGCYWIKIGTMPLILSRIV